MIAFHNPIEEDLCTFISQILMSNTQIEIFDSLREQITLKEITDVITNPC
jgi:hypothetical protein